MLPTFLGIGVPRAGTTWLHQLLDSHPDIGMAQGRKEVHFFDHNFERGPGWYERRFPHSAHPVAAGEITPHYLYDVRCIERIDRTLPGAGLLLSLRNPVDRLVSHFRHRQRVDGFGGNLDDFIRKYPQAVTWGRYATHLRPWLDRFPSERFCLLVFEEAVADVGGTLDRLAAFVGVAAAGFPAGAGTAAVNESFAPRHRRAHGLARRQARRLRGWDADWAVSLAKRLGAGGMAREMAGGGRPAGGSPLDDGRRRELWALFADDVAELEVLTGRPYASWQPAAGPGARE